MMSFMRTVIDVPDDIIQSLDQFGSSQKRSRASLIREALVEYLRNKKAPDAESAFGLWKEAPKDSLKYQQTLREKWEDR